MAREAAHAAIGFEFVANPPRISPVITRSRDWSNAGFLIRLALIRSVGNVCDNLCHSLVDCDKVRINEPEVGSVKHSKSVER